MLLGIALVHPEQISREQSRLVAAGSGADLEDGVAGIGLILGQKQELKLLLQRRNLLPDLLVLGLRQFTHIGIGIGIGHHRLQVRQFRAGRTNLGDAFDDGRQIREFLRHPDKGIRTGSLWIGQRVPEFLVAADNAVELFVETHLFLSFLFSRFRRRHYILCRRRVAILIDAEQAVERPFGLLPSRPPLPQSSARQGSAWPVTAREASG